MFAAIAKRLFGSANDRFIKSLGKTVDQINALEATVEPLTDEALAQRTVELRAVDSWAQVAGPISDRACNALAAGLVRFTCSPLAGWTHGRK